MNTSFRFALTLLSTALLLPNIIGCQSSTPRATSYQMNYQTPDQSQFQALPDVDADLFYKELKPYGNWINHKTYGRVWYPSGVPKNWRPYSNGHWARTQEYGWLWVANEPWGWAPFHYGRWAKDDGYGWIWVPGHTWAPAWVFWRTGGGYSAWAPMPPNAVWRPNVGLNTQHFDYGRDIHRDAWTGSCDRHLAYRDMSKHRPDISMSRIIHQTNIVQNNVAIVNNTIVNPGPVINVIDAPIVPVTVTTTVPVNVTTTSASTTATAVVVQPQIQAPTLEQVAKEEQLAKALAEQNAAAALANKKEPKESGRLTGVPAPEGIATPIKNEVKPSEAPVTPTPSQGQAVDSTIPTSPTPLPVTNPISTPQNPVPLPANTVTHTPRDPAPLPTPRDPAPLPTPQDPALLPTPQDPVPLPTPQDPAPLPTPRDPAPLPTPQDPAPLPTPRDPVPLPTPQDPVPLPASTFTPTPQNPVPLPASTFTPTLPEPTPQPAPMPSLPEPTPPPVATPSLPEPTPQPVAMPSPPEPTPPPAPMPSLPEPTPPPAPMPSLPEPTPPPVAVPAQPEPAPAPAPTPADDAAKKKADCLAAGRTDCDNP